MNQDNNEGLMYKATAFVIFIVLATLIVLISISTARSHNNAGAALTEVPGTATSDLIDTIVSSGSAVPDNTAGTSAAVSQAPTTNEPPVSTPPPETTSVTSAPPETTAPPKVDPSVDTPSVNISDELAAFLAEYPDTVLGVTEDAGQEYIDKMVFLGDSTTYGLRAYKMLSGGKETTQVWTPKSGTLTLSNASFATIVYPETNEEITIKEAVTRKKPEYLVITLGVNGVSFMGEDYFKSEYKKMLESVKEASPDTKIICQSIFPVARSYEYLKSINNEKIRNANKWIVEVADEVGVKFIDTYSVLCDSEGWLPENYHNGDGIHLHAASFTLELNNLRTHAYID